LDLVSKAPEGSIKDFEMKQNRFDLLHRAKPEVFERLAEQAQKEAVERFNFYTALANAKR
jgi:pyruvate-ferredoxin/flavodoxin oxidoreductase